MAFCHRFAGNEFGQCSVNDLTIDRAAHLLLEARRKGRQLEALPEACRPTDLDDANAVRKRLVELLGVGTCGWFLGGTNDSEVIPVAYAAPILDGNLHVSPAELSAQEFVTFEVDVEFGFRTACDIPPGEREFNDEETASLIASLHPTLDIVNSHFVDLEAVGWPSIVADNGTDGAVVYGPGVETWSPDELPDHEATLYVNGAPILSGTGRKIMGNPLSAFTWFVNCMSGTGQTVPAGTFVSTGSCTEVYAGVIGDHVKADFGALGSVEARYVA